MSKQAEYTTKDLVICHSADGWSIHAPGSTDEDIASGNAPYLLTGAGKVGASDLFAALEQLDRGARGAK